MANPETLKLARHMTEERETLKALYAEIAAHPALVDLLRELDNRADAETRSATLELDNAHKSASALQRASAYAKIKAYIMDMVL